MRKGECPDVGIHDVLDGLADQHLVRQRTMSLAMDERRTLPCDVSVCGVSGSVEAGPPIVLGPFGCGPAPWLEPITLPSSGVPSRKRSSLFLGQGVCDAASSSHGARDPRSHPGPADISTPARGYSARDRSGHPDGAAHF